MAESGRPQAHQYARGTKILVYGTYCIVDEVREVHDDGRVTWLDTEGRTHTSFWTVSG